MARSDHDYPPALRGCVIANIQIGNQIGRGSNGRILEAIWEGTTVAVKEIHSIFNGISDEEFFSLRRKFLYECEQASQMRHPNIVRFLGIYHPAGARIPSLVMERLHCSLDSLLEENPVVPMRTKLSIIKDVALGLRYLHTRNPPIIHRDLSSNNVLISKGMEGKIGDLGTARLIDSSRQSRMTKAPGTVDFMPPEALENVTNIRYGKKLDVFSYGCVMLHTLSHQWPTPSQAVIINPDTGVVVGGRSEVERRSQYFERIDKSRSHILIPLIKSCLSNLPENRTSIVTVCDQLTSQMEDKERVSINQSTLSALQQEIQEKNAELHRNRTEMQLKDNKISKKDGDIQRLTRLVQNNDSVLETLRSDLSKLQVTSSQKQINKSNCSFWNSLKLTWQQSADLPCKCWAISVAELDGKVFAAMMTSGSAYASPFVYNPYKDEWRSLPSLPCIHFGVATINQSKRLLVIGGTINTKEGVEISNKVFVWDDTIKRWTTPYPKMPTARYCCSCISYGSLVIVAGGIISLNPPKLTRMVEVLCIKDFTYPYWTVVEQLPFAMYEAIPLIVNNKLYLAQGYHTYGGTGTCSIIAASLPELLHSNNNQISASQIWKKLPDLPYSSHSISHYLGYLITFSGGRMVEKLDKDKPAAVYETVPLIYIYNPHINTWDCVGEIPHGYLLGRSAHIKQNEILFIGGVTGAQNSIDNDFMMTTCSTLTFSW